MQYSGIFLQVLCRIFVRADSQQELQQHIHTILGLIEVEDDNGQSLLLDYPHLKIMKQNQAPQPPKGGVTECATTPPSGGRGAYIAIIHTILGLIEVEDDNGQSLLLDYPRS